ncbi:nicotinate-nucleotide pyrophosphorylase [Maricurvus nonylphenolicus]|uniref:hypothetical protein n=1 Tax=Maricurvus nonylphenolicus TaxID=1008307 RepID=UPI0036F27C2F
MSKINTATAFSQTLFSSVAGECRAVVEATEAGVIAGLDFIQPEKLLSSDSGQEAHAGHWNIKVQDGQWVEAGEPLIEVIGSATELGITEDYIMGPLGFASGIATRAKVFQDACPEGLTISCGGWKKLPSPLKPLLRAGLVSVGILPRLVDGDFVYLSKNAVLLLGGVGEAIAAGVAMQHGPVAVQVKNVAEAEFAVEAGAGVIMVDTGALEDLAAVHERLSSLGCRDEVTLAFGGGARLEDLQVIRDLGGQAVDVGRDILNAPLFDLRMRVIPE